MRFVADSEVEMSTTVSHCQNFVGGEWVDAVEGETAEIVNPATGAAIAEVPRGSRADVDRAVEAAKKALPGWREATPGERAETLRRDAAPPARDGARHLAGVRLRRPNAKGGR